MKTYNERHGRNVVGVGPGGGNNVVANDIGTDEGLNGDAESEVGGDEVGGTNGSVLLDLGKDGVEDIGGKVTNTRGTDDSTKTKSIRACKS